LETVSSLRLISYWKRLGLAPATRYNPGEFPTPVAAVGCQPSVVQE
jgi:hypothetical protein